MPARVARVRPDSYERTALNMWGTPAQSTISFIKLRHLNSKMFQPKQIMLVSLMLLCNVKCHRRASIKFKGSDKTLDTHGGDKHTNVQTLVRLFVNCDWLATSPRPLSPRLMRIIHTLQVSTWMSMTVCLSGTYDWLANSLGCAPLLSPS